MCWRVFKKLRLALRGLYFVNGVSGKSKMKSHVFIDDYVAFSVQEPYARSLKVTGNTLPLFLRPHNQPARNQGKVLYNTLAQGLSTVGSETPGGP